MPAAKGQRPATSSLLLRSLSIYSMDKFRLKKRENDEKGIVNLSKKKQKQN